MTLSDRLAAALVALEDAATNAHTSDAILPLCAAARAWTLVADEVDGDPERAALRTTIAALQATLATAERERDEWKDRAQDAASGVRLLRATLREIGECAEQLPDEPTSDAVRRLKVRAESAERRLAEASVTRWTGAPDRCPVCEWSNTNLLNYGEAGKPRWMCHGCAARAIRGETPMAEASKPGPATDDIKPYVDQFRARRKAIPECLTVTSGDGSPYIAGLGDVRGARRIGCPSLDAAYVIVDAINIADYVIAHGRAEQAARVAELEAARARLAQQHDIAVGVGERLTASVDRLASHDAAWQAATGVATPGEVRRLTEAILRGAMFTALPGDAEGASDLFRALTAPGPVVLPAEQAPSEPDTNHPRVHCGAEECCGPMPAHGKDRPAQTSAGGDAGREADRRIVEAAYLFGFDDGFLCVGGRHRPLSEMRAEYVERRRADGFMPSHLAGKAPAPDDRPCHIDLIRGESYCTTHNLATIDSGSRPICPTRAAQAPAQVAQPAPVEVNPVRCPRIIPHGYQCALTNGHAGPCDDKRPKMPAPVAPAKGGRFVVVKAEDVGGRPARFFASTDGARRYASDCNGGEETLMVTKRGPVDEWAVVDTAPRGVLMTDARGSTSPAPSDVARLAAAIRAYAVEKFGPVHVASKPTALAAEDAAGILRHLAGQLPGVDQAEALIAAYVDAFAETSSTLCDRWAEVDQKRKDHAVATMRRALLAVGATEPARVTVGEIVEAAGDAARRPYATIGTLVRGVLNEKVVGKVVTP